MDQDRENYLAVDVFFALSGVVIGNAYEKRLQSGLTAGKFLLMRLIRLYPLYIFGTACTLVSMLLGFGTERHNGDFILLVALSILFLPYPAIGTSAYMFPFNPPAWSLFFELAANLFYACAVRFLTNRVLVAITVLSAVGLAIGLYVLPEHNLNIGFTLKSSPIGFCRVGYSFFTGMLLYRLFASKEVHITQKTLSVIVPWVILALLVTLLLSAPPKNLMPYFDFVCVVLAFPAMIYAALHFELTGAGAHICNFLGAISYAIYAVHDPILQSIYSISRRQHIEINDYAPIAGLGFLAFLLIFCWLLDRMYDWPVRRFLQRRLLPK